jgi:4-hydroxy-3-methylbut-2-en-1-yl diphosphate reductase
MNIHLATHFGLCFGVRDALAAAEQAARGRDLTILGELAHNPLVRERLARAGVRQGALADPGSAATDSVMITAHGASERDRARWVATGRTVLDGTCPLVRRAHQALHTLVREGFRPVIIGRAGHVEVEGLRGDFADALVIETEGDIARLPHEGRLGVISQTTQPVGRVADLVARVKALRPGCEIRWVDTVCQPTKDRQEAVRALAAACEIIVVVGGRNSNNTRELAATVEAAGRVAYRVEQAGELHARWFEGAQEVGVTAGTSTLAETVDEVVARLRTFAAAARLGLLEGCGR